MSCIPTFVNVPPPTAAKSQDTAPELLLIELLGGVPVCAETGRTPRSKSIAAPTKNKMTRVVASIHRTIRICSPLQQPSSKESPSNLYPWLLFGRIGATLSLVSIKIVRGTSDSEVSRIRDPS